MFPHYQDARRRRIVMSDCSTCLATQAMTTRQSMGCAYEQPVPGAQPWAPPSWREDAGMVLSTCPGYTTELPAVRELVDAFPQWKAGTLTDYLDGQAPTPVALGCLAVLDVAIEEAKADATREALKSKGGA